ncbi:hypothetical protein ASF83_13425 [Plantibacter sp. Leaf171]|uniref:DUF1353 domain-containing protein n=1 Tax=unclassified Plantibacter TaxID=2624265 RepID=UPI0006FAB9D8|nr:MULTISPECIES: DUF1353 domain-containing protein [unclassified Plantibacter]KQM16767.1 hypothetical protein ASE44_13435 [Plantibacter sp. Leaf1]KQR59903.1 hypothetical protein ASF83_13425 [Plantibacter sp. Leaf171]
MPYLDDDEQPLQRIDLAQIPPTGRLFRLERRIGFQEHAPDGPVVWAPAHDDARDTDDARRRTDLASVPGVLWSFIGSYGRQSAPAIVHDHRVSLALGLPSEEALTQRFEDDRQFRVGLRQQRVPLLRAWLMWAVVSVERYLRHAPRLAAVLIGQSVLGVLAIVAATIGLVTPLLGVQSPAWLALGIAPAVLAVFWREERRLLVWLPYAGALLAPLLLVQLVAVGAFRLLELLVRETIDRPFLDDSPGPVVSPTLR